MEQVYMSDFKALMRTVTSGRVMIISTKFRSDLFYCAENPVHDSILKLWALYVNTTISDLVASDIETFVGRKESFSAYFQSINKLSTKWLFYRMYQNAFYETYLNDQQNPVAMIVAGCDQHLVADERITRPALLSGKDCHLTVMTEDTFSLAMDILNNETHAN